MHGGPSNSGCASCIASLIARIDWDSINNSGLGMYLYYHNLLWIIRGRRLLSYKVFQNRGIKSAVFFDKEYKITTGFFLENTIVVAEGEMLLEGIFQVRVIFHFLETCLDQSDFVTSANSFSIWYIPALLFSFCSIWSW